MDKSKSDKINELIQKSLHAGSVYKLTLKDKPSEHDLRHWFANFLSLFNVDEQCIITKCPFLWRDGGISSEDNDPMFGYPSSIDQLLYIVDDGRLDKVEFTDAEIDSLRNLEVFTEVPATTPVETCACGKKCCKVCIKTRRIADRLMKFVTGGMHNDA